MIAAALAALLAVALAACTSSSPHPTPTRTAAHTPLFASDDEALQAATKAYAAYLKMSDTISHDGGKNPERIRAYVTDSELRKLVSDFKQLEQKGAHTDGYSKFSDLRIGHYDNYRLQVYLCSDVSDVRLLDASDRDITPPDRTDVLPLTITFVGAKSNLRIAESVKWLGEDFCRQ